jgi:YEATS domain-containing protein 4
MPAPSNAVRSSNTARNETNNSSKESTRLSKTTACLPLVYGSIAFYLGKKADEFQTHEWTLFLRGPNNEDLSAVISKVAFQLHASFAQPIRELTQPPFEVTERGWGEFEAQIKIVWKDPTEKPTLVCSFDETQVNT